ncbi:MAG: SusC/RagA family TonB-linked outer membrane protein, partial [Bacteroidota bacterium]
IVRLGQGNPPVELGWTTRLNVRNWQVAALFRGAFGHVLVNQTRQFHELEYSDQSIPVYNRIETDLAEAGLVVNRFSSLYVESADFLTLDYLTLARTFQFKRPRGPKALTVSLTGQNLFTLTTYTGLDPEPALEDEGTRFFESIAFPIRPADPFVAGIDRRYSYLPSRTVVLGVRLAL